ncbi:winged helix-turn-helix DNA-binding domain protein [Vibrio phage 1.101.O._10N.261.45.C6]|nr:winged helix-turn-helix DNA-binding domain protein [Vibrio phage 1.101.O._10N.261.45.C6]
MSLSNLLKIKTYKRKPFNLTHKMLYFILIKSTGKEISHKQLGDYIGISSRTTVSKTMKQLKDFGLVTQSGENGKVFSYSTEHIDFGQVDLPVKDSLFNVYLCHIEDDYYKIGITSNTESRWKSLEKEFCRELNFCWTSGLMDKTKAEYLEREVLVSVNPCGFLGKYPKEVFKVVNLRRLIDTLNIKKMELPK